MDIVFGLSMTPASIRMVLVEGHKADGVTIEEREFAVDALGSAIDQLVASLLDAREAVAAAGNRVTSVGVTCIDESDVHVLDEALAAYDVGNVTITSPFLAATTLAQAVAQAINSERMAVLFVEPDSMTLAVIDTDQGVIADIRSEPLRGLDAIATPTELIAWAESLGSRPDGIFLIGSGADISLIKLTLEKVTRLAVIVPEEPETALARGAALASVDASLSALATDSFAYARVPDAVEADSDAVTLDRFSSGVPPDGEADAPTTALGTTEEAGLDAALQQRRPIMLLSSVGAVTLISAVVALEVSLALGIRPAAVGLQHVPGQNRLVQAPLLPLAPVAVAAAPRPTAMRPSSPVPQLPSADAFIPPPPAAPPGDSPGAAPSLLALPVLMPNPVPGRTPDVDYPNYPILLPLPVVAPPSLPQRQLPTVPVSQPPSSQPPVTTVPVSQPPSSQPPVTTVPVSQPPSSQPPVTTVPVSQPPTYVPVSQPPTPVPVAPPPVRVTEPQVPVNLPASDGPGIAGPPAAETPPVLGPVLGGPTIPATPGSGVAGQDAPPVVTQLPGSLTSPAQDPLPSSGGGGSPVGGGAGPFGGGNPGSAGTGPSLTAGGSVGGGGGSLGGGGSSIGGSSSIGGGSSIGGSSSIGGGSSIGGSSSSSGGSSGGGGKR